jgi:hypothetical protein
VFNGTARTFALPPEFFFIIIVFQVDNFRTAAQHVYNFVVFAAGVIIGVVFPLPRNMF